MEQEIKQLRFDLDTLTNRCKNIEKLIFHFHEIDMINFIAKKTKQIIKDNDKNIDDNSDIDINDIK